MKKRLIQLTACFLFMQVNAQITTVTQLMDIKPSDTCYAAVQNLVERYGILGVDEKRQNFNYLPNNPLTRRSFAIVMVNALNQITELMKGFVINEKPARQDSLTWYFKKERMRGYAYAAVKQMPGSAKYTDLNKDDPDLKYIQQLTDKYKLKLGDAGNKFSPDRAMTVAELKTIFTRYFDAPKVIKGTSNKVVTRGAWAIYLSEVLELMIDDMSELVDGKEEMEKEKEREKKKRD